MRKMISLGLLALSLSILSSQVLASNAAACDEAKLTKGLHGLCVAWHNANDKNKDKFADKYRERSGGDEVPGSVDPEPEVVCPCWTPDSLADAVAGDVGVFCIASVDMDAAIYSGNQPQAFAGILQPESGTECLLTTGTAIFNSVTTSEENDLCRSDVQALQESTDESGNDLFPPCVL